MATLVVGGAGYIGSHIVVALHASGRDAVLLDDFSGSSPRVVDAIRGLTSSVIAVEECDAADHSMLNAVFTRHPIDSVIHLAAFKNMPESRAEPLRYYRNNLASVISVAEAAVEHGVRRLVFSSSAAVYGTPRSVPVTEESVLAPNSPYGRTKLMGEQILSDVASVSELEVVVLRYFNPVGAHPSGRIGEDSTSMPDNLVPRIMRTATGQSGPVPVFGNDYDTPDGTAVRDYIHVVDLAEGHVAALVSSRAGESVLVSSRAGESVLVSSRADNPVCGTVYNLGTGVGSSVMEVLTAAAAATGLPIAHEIVDRRLGDVDGIWADCRRAHRDLGWIAQHDLFSMLRDHWNWQRNNPHGYLV